MNKKIKNLRYTGDRKLLWAGITLSLHVYEISTYEGFEDFRKVCVKLNGIWEGKGIYGIKDNRIFKYSEEDIEELIDMITDTLIDIKVWRDMSE